MRACVCACVSRLTFARVKVLGHRAVVAAVRRQVHRCRRRQIRRRLHRGAGGAAGRAAVTRRSARVDGRPRDTHDWTRTPGPRPARRSVGPSVRSIRNTGSRRHGDTDDDEKSRRRRRRRRWWRSLERSVSLGAASAG